MQILVVAATALEVPHLSSGPRGAHHIDVLVTGVGMVATAAQTARAISVTSYDLALNFGVCGAFDRSLALGTVVHVVRDEFSELGVEDGERFISMQELGLTTYASIENAAPPSSEVLESLPPVRGITVNTVHGHDPSIARVMSQLQPQIESMEGAAFAYACAMGGVPYAQVRAVSNIVERRNRAAWRLELAIGNLNVTASKLFESL
jgi:futalosine hydrolase